MPTNHNLKMITTLVIPAILRKQDLPSYYTCPNSLLYIVGVPKIPWVLTLKHKRGLYLQGKTISTSKCSFKIFMGQEKVKSQQGEL